MNKYTYPLKTLIKPFHHHKKEKEDIFIFTLGRSGSTLLTDILALAPGMKMVEEPFSLEAHNRPVLQSYLQDAFPRERYIDLEEGEWGQVLGFLFRLSETNTVSNINLTRLKKGEHQFKTNRTLFKIHKLNALASDILSCLEGKAIFLLRHPISHSLSRYRLKWGTYILPFLYSKKVGSLLPSRLKDILLEVDNQGTWLEKYVASWCLENYGLLSQPAQLDKERYVLLSYEELVALPNETVQKLCDFLAIDFHTKMTQKLNDPSRGIVHSTNETAREIKDGKGNALLAKWREMVTVEHEEKAFKIMDAFGFDIYQRGEDLPHEKYRVFV